MRTIRKMVVVLSWMTGGIVLADEIEGLKAQLAEAHGVTDKVMKSHERTADLYRETVERLERATGLLEESMEHQAGLQFQLLVASHEQFLESIKGLGFAAKASRMALEVMGEDLGDDPKKLAYLAEAAKCLKMEVIYRGTWRIWANGKMTRKMRDKIGTEWLKMVEENDAISKTVEVNNGNLPEVVLGWRAEREKEKAGPRVPEPEIVEE